MQAVPEQQKQEYNTRAKQFDKQKRAEKSNEMAGKLDCTGLYVTVSNPGGGDDKSSEMSGKLDCTGLYVTISRGITGIFF